MLKFRYALYLFIVLLVLVLFAAGIVVFLQKGMYLYVVVFFLLLYPSTYYLGRKMTRVFLLLSCLKFIRNNNGSITHNQYETFIRSCARKGHTAVHIDLYLDDILNTLESENLVEIEGDSIILTVP